MVRAEHQSSPSPLMGLRLLIYMGRIWDRWIRRQEERVRAGKRKPPRRIPAILPLVVFQRPGAWAASTSSTDLIDLPPEQLDAVRPHLPAFRYPLENLSQISDDEIRARGLSPLGAVGLVLLKHARDKRERWISRKTRISRKPLQAGRTNLDHPPKSPQYRGQRRATRQ